MFDERREVVAMFTIAGTYENRKRENEIFAHLHEEGGSTCSNTTGNLPRSFRFGACRLRSLGRGALLGGGGGSSDSNKNLSWQGYRHPQAFFCCIQFS